jgi:glycosyltransferase involved in cell wall biosynthesis
MQSPAPISVIIPVYNGEKYLLECLNSVFQQTTPPAEVIVVNDGSTDTTLQKLEAYPGISLIISTENRGPSATLNEGISHATQPWIAFLDADDCWISQKLEWQYQYLRQDTAIKILFGRMLQFHSPELSEEAKAKIYCPNVPEMGWVKPTMLVHHSVFAEVGYFNEALRHGDFIDWFERVKEAGVKFDMIDEVVLRRRLHLNSLTRQLSFQKDYARLLKERLDRKRNLK